MSNLTRITVNLTPQAVAALGDEQKTDAINRALVLYAVIRDIQREDGRALTLLRADGTTERIRFL